MKLSKQEIVVLRETFLFHHMSSRDYLDFSHQEHPDYVRLQLQPKEQLLFPEQDENSIAIITSGCLRLPQGDKLPDQLMRDGFVIGALDLFSLSSYAVPEIYAVEESTLLLISASQMRQLFEIYPAIMMRYINFLTGQLQALRWENSLVTNTSVEARLLQFLAQNARREKSTAVVRLSYSFSALADRLHFSRATLYRIFDSMEADGFLRREGRTLIVLKPDLLPATEFI